MHRTGTARTLGGGEYEITLATKENAPEKGQRLPTGEMAFEELTNRMGITNLALRSKVPIRFYEKGRGRNRSKTGQTRPRRGVFWLTVANLRKVTNFWRVTIYDAR